VAGLFWVGDSWETAGVCGKPFLGGTVAFGRCKASVPLWVGDSWEAVGVRGMPLWGAVTDLGRREPVPGISGSAVPHSFQAWLGVETVETFQASHAWLGG